MAGVFSSLCTQAPAIAATGTSKTLSVLQTIVLDGISSAVACGQYRRVVATWFTQRFILASEAGKARASALSLGMFGRACCWDGCLCRRQRDCTPVLYRCNEDTLSQAPALAWRRLFLARALHSRYDGDVGESSPERLPGIMLHGVQGRLQ